MGHLSGTIIRAYSPNKQRRLKKKGGFRMTPYFFGLSNQMSDDIFIINNKEKEQVWKRNDSFNFKHVEFPEQSRYTLFITWEK